MNFALRSALGRLGGCFHDHSGNVVGTVARAYLPPTPQCASRVTLFGVGTQGSSPSALDGVIPMLSILGMMSLTEARGRLPIHLLLACMEAIPSTVAVASRSFGLKRAFPTERNDGLKCRPS
jgi:hypothetical protein